MREFLAYMLMLVASLFELFQTLADLLLKWAAWIVAVLSMAIAWWYARRSARAAERSERIAQDALTASQRSARAAEESADVAREALEHSQEVETRRGRESLNALVVRVKAEADKAKKRSDRVLTLAKSLAGFSATTGHLARKKEELEDLAEEIQRHVEFADSFNIESDNLTPDFAEDELEQVVTALQVDLSWLEGQTETLSIEAQDLQKKIEICQSRGW